MNPNTFTVGNNSPSLPNTPNAAQQLNINVPGSDAIIQQLGTIGERLGSLGGVMQLDYIASTDLATAAALAANTWTDFPGISFTFNVSKNGSIVAFIPKGHLKVGGGVGAQDNSSRLVIDAAGSNIIRYMGGSTTNAQHGNGLNGSQPIIVTGLSQGSHTVKVQVRSTVAGTMYCRAASQPNEEFFSMQILELPQTFSSPVANLLGTGIPVQNIATNSNFPVPSIQTGWSYVNGTGATNQSQTITFPVPYASAPIVQLTPLGFKTTAGAPATIGDFTVGVVASALGNAINITNTGFTIYYHRNDASAWAAGTYAGMSWLAIGQ